MAIRHLDKKGRSVTLKDVADQANVSPFTVSVVLNGSKSNTRVSAATKERILVAATELGYQPNGLARALQSRKTNILGLYFGYGQLEPHDPFHAEILTGLQKGCEATKKDLMIHYSFHQYSVGEVFSELVCGKIDGLILIASPSDPLVEKVRGSKLAVVAITDPIEGIPSVVADDHAGSVDIANHLHEKGHKVVLYRTCPGASASAARRQKAFEHRASALGIKVISGRTTDWKGGVESQEADILERREELGITAAVCWGDPSAYALISFCKSRGIRIPSDLAVVGFNGIDPPVEPAHHLTTIRANWAFVAESAVKQLVDILDGHDTSPLTTLPVKLYVGDTT